MRSGSRGLPVVHAEGSFITRSWSTAREIFQHAWSEVADPWHTRLSDWSYSKVARSIAAERESDDVLYNRPSKLCYRCSHPETYAAQRARSNIVEFCLQLSLAIARSC